MPKFSSRERVIAAVLAAVLIVGGAINWVIKPLISGAEALDNEIDLSRQRLSKGLEKKSGSDQIEKEFQKLVTIWGIAASDTVESSELISKLEAAAQEANVHILNMEPQPVIKDALVRYPVDLIITGRWTSVVRFLYLIQTRPLMLNIESMNLEKSSERTAILQGKITVSRLRISR